MKIGVYTRVSTDLQVRRGESLDEQLHEARLYCKYKDIPIVQVYREEGRSGKNIDRPQLKKLLRDIQRKKIDTVIVKKLDRLSRSILDFEKLLRLFEENNITLISLKESFDTSSPMSRAAVRIVLVFAQLEREQTSERTRDAMIYRAKRGIWNGGHIPLGYDIASNRKELVFNEEEALLVKLIFEKYIELASYRKVAQNMNDLGYRTKRHVSKKATKIGGIKFIDTSISRVVQNPVYLGKISYKGEVYSANHKPIISEDLFNHVQDIRKENGRRRNSLKRENKHNFLLEGLLSCGECNTQMTPRWSIGRSKRYFYYACTKAIHSGKNACSIRTISASAIEQLVLNRIRSLAKDNELFRNVMAGNDQKNRQRIEELGKIEQDLNSKIASIDNKVKILASAFGEAIDKDNQHVMALELNRLNEERKQYAQDQEEARIEVKDLESETISMGAARESLNAFTNAYGSLSPYDKKCLMNQLIHSVIYTKGEVSIRYYLMTDLDVLINKEEPMTVLQRLPIGSPLLTQNKTFIDTFQIVTYKVRDGKQKLKVDVQRSIPDGKRGMAPEQSEISARPAVSQALSR